MKKKHIVDLIRYHVDKNDEGFKREANIVAKEFDSMGDPLLAESIMSLIEGTYTFLPKDIENPSNSFVTKVTLKEQSIPFPQPILENISGITNAIQSNIGVNRFLFHGPPGTGKTEAAKHIAQTLDRELFLVDFDTLIDSKLGQTSKNISTLFEEIAQVAHKDKIVILFDEIDAIALDRINSNDIREMGRATSAILRGLDILDENIVLLATTNLYQSFDKALIRRFNASIDFSGYTTEDLILIAEKILQDWRVKFKFAGQNIKLFKKILQTAETLPYPGDLTNLIKTSLAFSEPTDKFDYLKRLYLNLHGALIEETLLQQGFTLKEIKILLTK